MGDVERELERSRNALAAAETLLAEGLHDDAASRLYYAVFHAARAMLWKENPDLSPKTHRGVRTLLARELIAKGKAPEEFLSLLSDLARERERADYGSGGVSLDLLERRVERARKILRNRNLFTPQSITNLR